jgi:hypothetical protein
VYAAQQPRPAHPPGRFPFDPVWIDITDVDLDLDPINTAFSYDPPADDRYYVVIGVGESGDEGPSGHHVAAATNDEDGDGLSDISDPCPDQPLNECFGLVAHDETASWPLRINTDSTSTDACSGLKADCRGRLWVADFGVDDHGSGYNVAEAPFTCDLPNGCPVDASGLFGCTDGSTEEIFRCEHWDEEDAPELRYTFDVPDGRYLVNLLFMNAYSGTTEPGSRVFSVAINDEVPPQLASFDQVVAAGGVCDPYDAACRGVNRAALVTVLEGNGLQIEFQGEVQRPAIKGIEVLREGP